MIRHRHLQDRMTCKISVPKDETGMTGRECPVKDCLGYFKVKFGTGLKGGKLRVLVTRILKKYGYTPDKQEQATQTVLRQAELLYADWAA